MDSSSSRNAVRPVALPRSRSVASDGSVQHRASRSGSSPVRTASTRLMFRRAPACLSRRRTAWRIGENPRSRCKSSWRCRSVSSHRSKPASTQASRSGSGKPQTIWNRAHRRAWSRAVSTPAGRSPDCWSVPRAEPSHRSVRQACVCSTPPRSGMSCAPSHCPPHLGDRRSGLEPVSRVGSFTQLVSVVVQPMQVEVVAPGPVGLPDVTTPGVSRLSTTHAGPDSRSTRSTRPDASWKSASASQNAISFTAPSRARRRGSRARRP